MKAAVRAALLSVVACSGFLSGVTHAAADPDDRIAALEKKLETSLKLIESLTARVQELETQKAGGASTPASSTTAAAPPDPTQRIDSLERQLSQMEGANAAAHGADMGLPLHGFADVGGGYRDSTVDGTKGFNMGSLEFYLNPRLGERTRALFELIFEAEADGTVEADLERAQLGYEFGDAATVWIGRFHTPLGYYNTAFHHGQQIATSLRRPRFLLFEDQGGIMPNHTVGAWLTGSGRAGEGRVTYDLFVGNGQAIDGGSIDAHNAGLTHGGAIYGTNLGYVFGDSLNGLKVGVSAFRSKVSDDQLVGRLTRIDNAGLYFAYDSDRFEHIGEFYRFSDRDLAGGNVHHSDAGFLQLAWRLPLATPYMRFERAVLDQRDTYFALQQRGMSYRRTALGVRFDLDLQSALKLEWSRTNNTDRAIDQWSEALLQYAIRF